MKALFLFFIFGALAWSTQLRAGEEFSALTKPLQMSKVPDKPVYFSIGSPGIPGKENEGNTSNAGFVVTDGGVVVFDALGTPSLGQALMEEARKVTDKPVRYVVVSHYHADHIYGLQAMKAAFPNAVVIAEERGLEYQENTEISDERADARLQQRRDALFPWVNKDTRVIPPDVVFKEQASIRLGGHQFLLIYAGPAHSSSDTMMMVQPEGVLFAGDIVQNGRVPFMNSDDVNTSRWLKSLEEVKVLKPTFIIPGHGRSSTQAAEAIAFTSKYIKYVRDEMQKAVDVWADFDTAYVQVDWSAYANLPAFSSNNRGNAYRIYLELEAANFGKDSKVAQ
jgi:glyoxylase-like metal-dependent hydrolase (beta-lactamase superfamily II)